jgi:hypothetical protein
MFARPAEAEVYQGAVSWILSRSEPREPIMIGPQLTALYVLTDRRDALPHLSLLPGALPTEADERDAITRLDNARVRLILTDRQRFDHYGHTSFGGSFQRLLAAWIQERFTHAATLGDPSAGGHVVDVWLRR